MNSPDFISLSGEPVIGLECVPCSEWKGPFPIYEKTEPVTIRRWRRIIHILEVSNITGIATNKLVSVRAFSRKSKKAYKGETKC
jgi:hypothetical protein